MTMKTEADAAAALRQILANSHGEGPEAQATKVIAQLRVLPPLVTATQRETQPEPELLQIWRNRSSNRLVKIVSLGAGRSTSQISWEAADASRGPRNGRVFAHNWDSRFDYVGMSE